jgi:Flp pilus assembly protein TadB
MLLCDTPRQTYRDPLTKAREHGMGILKVLGLAIIVLWLVLWLAVKVTVATIHLLLLVGVVLLVLGLLKRG